MHDIEQKLDSSKLLIMNISNAFVSEIIIVRRRLSRLITNISNGLATFPLCYNRNVVDLRESSISKSGNIRIKNIHL